MPAGLTRIRKPAAAGIFYPSQPAALLSTIQELLAGTHAEPAAAIAVLVPHSGYQYSGRTAAAALARVDVPRTVIIVAPTHTGVGLSRHGGSAWAVGALRTPLADVPVDETLTAALLARCQYLEDDPDAHRIEHGIEVVLPFLVARRPDVTVVPILLDWTDWPRARALGEALADVVRAAAEPVLIVASTDMNHHETAAENRRKDDLALEAIERLDGEALLEVTRQHRISMCGRTAAAAVVHAAKLLGATRGEIVHTSHSGEMTHDDSSVVGYAGVVMR